MGADRDVGDDGVRMFKIDFSEDGEARLAATVGERLKEFMGDYTDETLVGYIVVLLKNGRRKDEIADQLSTFLENDTDKFVSWLWDHLSSNMHLYVRTQQETFPDKVAKIDADKEKEKLTKAKIDADKEKEKLTKGSRSRQSRELKTLVNNNELFPLRSVLTDVLHTDERTSRKADSSKRSLSLRPQVHIKRSRDEEQLPRKKESPSRPVIGAPRRLLQYAVRDVVKNLHQPNSRNEPPVKRLRSVVSTATSNSCEDQEPQRRRAVVSNALSTALKAVAEAAADVSRTRSSSSVFDRLSHARSTAECIHQESPERIKEVEDGTYEYFNRDMEIDQTDHDKESEYDEPPRNISIMDKGIAITVDSTSNNDACDADGFDLESSQAAPSVNKGKKSVKMEHNVAQEPKEELRKRRLHQDLPATLATITPSKIVNISVNVNTWKPSHYPVLRNTSELENQAKMDKSDASAEKLKVAVLKENGLSGAQSLKTMELLDGQKASQKTTSTPGSYNTGRPLENVDSRTLFVSNVHFAATKDTLSRHFNKFGDVLKVLIITDAATGQPTGSAYVEFLKKESADRALSLNGTSFMSRILKVVLRSSYEGAPMLDWPRIAGPSTYASRIGRISYPRGAFTGFRGRAPVIPGARSLQWKRDASTPQPGEGSTVISPTSRSLTYLRSEPKSDEHSGAA